jgi:DNA invertase Pin-like site-specific DNA recombinase
MTAYLIGYLRVSTKKQEDSGLGMEAQRTAIDTYARQHGASILTYYLEVETGKRSDRPELARALAHARRSKARLVVAKLDRLARNVAFTATLLRSGVDFVACDNPHANKLTIHILAAMAEHEAEQISARTKAALAAYKARGGLLGSARPGHWDGTTVTGRPRREARRLGSLKGAVVSTRLRREAAKNAYADIAPVIMSLRDGGLSYGAIAKRLTNSGHTTRRGRPWNPTQVWLVYARTLEAEMAL